MPLTKEHKAETRKKIVDGARRLFKTRGYDRVSIDDIMADAGLTRGGFYAHFSSKEDLFREAVGEIVLATGLRQHERTGTKEPDGWRQGVIDWYLSTEHRDHPNGGCPMAALSAQVARAGTAARDTYTEVLKDLVDAIAQRLPDEHPGAERAALATVAECVGAMVIARAVNDDSVAQQAFEAGRWATRRLAEA